MRAFPLPQCQGGGAHLRPCRTRAVQVLGGARFSAAAARLRACADAHASRRRSGRLPRRSAARRLRCACRRSGRAASSPSWRSCSTRRGCCPRRTRPARTPASSSTFPSPACERRRRRRCRCWWGPQTRCASGRERVLRPKALRLTWQRAHVQGSVCTIGVQPPAEGVDRVREVIRAKKAAHFHTTLTRHLRCAALQATPQPSPSDASGVQGGGRRDIRHRSHRHPGCAGGGAAGGAQSSL